MDDPIEAAVERAGGDPPPVAADALAQGRALLVVRASEEDASDAPTVPASWTRRRALGVSVAASAVAVAVVAAALVGRRGDAPGPTIAGPGDDASVEPFDIEAASSVFVHGVVDYEPFPDTTAMAAASDLVVLGTVLGIRAARVPPVGDTAGVRWDTVLVELRVDREAAGAGRRPGDGRILVEVEGQRPGATRDEQRAALPAGTRMVAYLVAGDLGTSGEAIAYYRPIGLQSVTVQGARGGPLVRPLLGQTDDAPLDEALPVGTSIGS